MLPQFYMPEFYMPDADKRQEWEAGTPGKLEESGKIACAQCWIYQTWLALRQAGVSVPLVHSLPESGIAISLTCFSGDHYRPPADVYLAGIVADYLPHPGAHFHILQNSAHASRLPYSGFMPLWPQPGLIPRDPARGDRLENVCFFGDPGNLAPELGEAGWRKKLKDSLGVNLVIRRADKWHDYSEADAVLAIRSFDSRHYWHKPATKLYNAWLAGVPFIGGMDSAYASDGKAGTNFLQARTPDDLLDCIRRLKEAPAFRERLVTAGHAAGEHFTPQAILQRWKTLIQDTLPRRAEKWFRRSPSSRRISTAINTGSVWLDRRLRN